MTEQFQQWFNQGLGLANLGKFEEAIASQNFVNASFDEVLKIKPDEPDASVLALSKTERLTLEDILQLPFHNYEMVSLSACETAITGSQTITTEYVGLVSGFISKGVRNVVSTLWRVESISSALFAIREAPSLRLIAFYRQPDRDTAPAAALKRTQRWLL